MNDYTMKLMSSSHINDMYREKAQINLAREAEEAQANETTAPRQWLSGLLASFSAYLAPRSDASVPRAFRPSLRPRKV